MFPNFLSPKVGRGQWGSLSTPLPAPNCRRVTFPSEQGGYLEGAEGRSGGREGHFSGKGTGVILVWISSLFSGLQHKGGEKKLAQAGIAPGIRYLLSSNTLIPIPSNLYTRTHHTHLPLWPQEVLRKPDTNQNMGSDLEPPS